jgi:hypothetical protein
MIWIETSNRSRCIGASAATRRPDDSPVVKRCERSEQSRNPGSLSARESVEQIASHLSGASPRPSQAAACFPAMFGIWIANSAPVGYDDPMIAQWWSVLRKCTLPLAVPGRSGHDHGMIWIETSNRSRCIGASAATRRPYDSPVVERCERSEQSRNPGSLSARESVEEFASHLSGGSPRPSQAAACFGHVWQEANSEPVGYVDR